MITNNKLLWLKYKIYKIKLLNTPTFLAETSTFIRGSDKNFYEEHDV